MARRLRLGTGIEVLDAWTATASERDVNAVTDALFAIVERTVYTRYPVVEDSALARELVVVVRDDLAVRVRLDDVEKFGVLFVGAPADALAAGKAAAAAG